MSFLNDKGECYSKCIFLLSKYVNSYKYSLFLFSYFCVFKFCLDQNKIPTHLFLSFFYITEFLGYRAFLHGLRN